MQDGTAAAPSRQGRRLPWAGALVGFALGGFFDGILLHQILQWHHLLSGVDAAALQDIRAQVLADGLFHALMYIVAAAGLWLLWQSRREFTPAGAGRRLLAWALIGFGAWHILDSILSHWILGIHRIRMDVDNQLFWDLLWFALFGVLAVAAGCWLLRGRREGGGGCPGRRRAAPAALALSVLLLGPVAALPPADVSTVMVLFGPGATMPEVMAAMAAVDGRMIWSDPSGQLWAVDIAGGGDPLALYGHGAWLVSSSFLPVGCLNWFRA